MKTMHMFKNLNHFPPRRSLNMMTCLYRNGTANWWPLLLQVLCGPANHHMHHTHSLLDRARRPVPYCQVVWTQAHQTQYVIWWFCKLKTRICRDSVLFGHLCSFAATSAFVSFYISEQVILIENIFIISL